MKKEFELIVKTVEVAKYIDEQRYDKAREVINSWITKYTDSNQSLLIENLSEDKLITLFSSRSKLHPIINSSVISKETFNALITRLSPKYCLKVLFNQDKDIIYCEDLGEILNRIDRSEISTLLSIIGKEKLSEIVKDLFNLRDVNEAFHSKLFQFLGYEYIAKLIDNKYYLIKTLEQIPLPDRLDFVLNKVGAEKLRAYVKSDEQLDELLRMIPKSNHQLIKNVVLLYKVSINKIDYTPQQNREEIETKIPQQMKNSRIFDNQFIVGNHLQNYRYRFVIYDTANKKIHYENSNYYEIIYLDDNAFLVHEYFSNTFRRIEYQNQKFYETDTIYCPWDKETAERYQCMIELPNKKWMILSTETNNIINDYKGWYIDIFDPISMTIEHKLSIDRDSHNTFPTQLKLLPDGKTVLVWDAFGDHKKHEISLIDITNFTIQTVTIPIPVKGKLKQIDITDTNQIMLVIETEGKYLMTYQFNYERLSSSFNQSPTRFSGSLFSQAETTVGYKTENDYKPIHIPWLK